MTHICVSKLTIIASDNGLSPGRRQAIIWTAAGILLIGPLGTNFSEILIGIQTFSFKKIHLKMSSAKWRPLYRPQCVKRVCSDRHDTWRESIWSNISYQHMAMYYQTPKFISSVGVLNSGPIYTKETPSGGYLHFKHTMVSRPPHVYNGNLYTQKTRSFSWIEAQDLWHQQHPFPGYLFHISIFPKEPS